MKRSRRRSSFPSAVGLAVALAWPVLAGAEDAKKPAAKPAAQPTPEKKPSLSDSPYSGGPPPITGGFTDTWQGGKKTSGAIPPGLIGGAPGGGSK